MDARVGQSQPPPVWNARANRSPSLSSRNSPRSVYNASLVCRCPGQHFVRDIPMIRVRLAFRKRVVLRCCRVMVYNECINKSITTRSKGEQQQPRRSSHTPA
eukprot:8178168-Pyramimonas_sp.AAC.2